MKVLVSAYACAPWGGSEPGAGWSWVRAIAERHEVWLLTLPRWRRHIEPHMAQFPRMSERIHIEYVAASEWANGFRTEDEEPNVLHAYLWQRAAARVGKRLHREIGFDIAHHITWTVTWLPAGVSRIRGLPFVWGPVSGAAGTPRSLYRWLGLRGAAKEMIREGVLPLARAGFGSRPLRSASLVIAGNEEVGRWARKGTTKPVVVEPIVCVAMVNLPDPVERSADEGHAKRAVFASRLVHWKGLRLAIAGLARPGGDAWTLDVYGTGPEERAARRLAEELGVGSRVRFLGHVPLKEMHAAIASADAFVHPSIHDAPPFAVGEALAMGTPVICLDHGGPTALLEDGQGVKVPTSGDIAAGMGVAYGSVPARFPATERWAIRRLPDFLDDSYRKALAAG